MPNNKAIVAFYLATAVILYCAYSTLGFSRFGPDLPNPMHYAKRVTK